jgi:Signal transduction histidine kinase
MSEYYDLTDKIVIFLCCSVLFIFQGDVSVVPMLAAITASSMLSYLDKDRLKILITASFIALSIIEPQLAFFLPLICYDLLFTKYQYINLLLIIGLAEIFKATSMNITAFYILIVLISILFRYRTEAYTDLKNKYNIMSDAKNEMSIQLKKQNYDLAEKQDYEVNLATLNERNRIAREIHDSVGHLLSSSILQVGALITMNRDERIRDSLKDLSLTLTQAMNSIRSSVHNLYEESIDLNTQVEELVNKFTFCPVSFDYGLISNPDKKLKYAFIFIIKEALSNIMKHSNASQVSITFREHPAIYQLIIRDNGRVEDCKTEDGIGLKNMTDRIGALNGNINFSSSNGFEIFISVPKGDI